ncbi:chaperonin 10-like protein [Leucosporidium creatinivorum]|uniref:Chaperonin 10-like protein n=1 Tax=Leucosporidium creatinivorum TaxID=106004 RepID=A0A1Y2G0E0_9BASI|nr:chaperonin 10-like protein [Leucosporidium creatinivorum]
MTQTHKAYIVQEDRSLRLEEVPLPTAGAGEIVVKVEAVALNPTDWKYRDAAAKVGSGLGCDFAGTVVQAGEGSVVKEGEKVAGFVHGGLRPGHGSFSEHVTTKSTLVWKVPSSVGLEEAAALGGIAPDTAFQALALRHGLPVLGEPITDKKPFLVWAASTSVGMYAIQVAKLAGYTVIATASPKNEALVKSFGADAVYPYADESTPAKIAEAFPSLSQAMDCISEQGSTLAIAKSFASKAGKIVTILPVKDETLATEFPEVKHDFTLVYTTLGDYFDFGPIPFAANPEDQKATEEWKKKVPELITSGKLKANPIWHQEGGLAAINDGLELLKAGKNSAQKITFTY